jgi:membrane-associated phospholipid phosphatase
MNSRIKVFIILIFFIPAYAFSQQDTLIKKLDSLQIVEQNQVAPPPNNISAGAYNDSTKFTFKNYFILLGSDFKQQVTYPFHATKKDWKKVAVFGAITAAVAFADKPVSKFFTSVTYRSKPLLGISNIVTTFGGLYEVYSLAAITTYGLLFKNEKIKSTAFLATQAYITAGVIQGSLKFLSKRQRPNYIDVKTNTTNKTFHGPFYKFAAQSSGIKPNSSFPSGHTSVAFAAATVYAMEYRHHPWIPIFSYSFASLVGLSRITEKKHWPTDVLVGAALGILSGRQVVNNYHRYMKIKQPEKPIRQRKGTISFNLQPFDGRVLPGVIYSFN